MENHDMQSSNNFTKKSWLRRDTTWLLSLYGTAIGAGVLYLPIEVGLSGFFPVILLVLFAFPTTYFAHLNLSRIITSGKAKSADLSYVVEEYFGSFWGRVITTIYFISTYTMLLVYCIALTNNISNFITNILGYHTPDRGILSFLIVACLTIILSFGEKFVLETIGLLVIPFICILMIFSLFMIPHWNIHELQMFPVLTDVSNTEQSMLKTLWLTTPLMVFSFNFLAIISPFSVSNSHFYKAECETKTKQILFFSTLLMVGTALFFVLSCIFTLSPHDLALAKKANLSILDYLPVYFHKPFVRYFGSIIAFVAISKSFFGHYLGAREVAYRLLISLKKNKKLSITKQKVDFIFIFFVSVTSWIMATLNLSVIKSIESFVGPCVALLLFIMPVYAIYKCRSLVKFRKILPNILVVSIGFIAISATIYGFLL